MIELLLAGGGIVVALGGVIYSLARPRDDAAVIESGRPRKLPR